MNLGTQTPDYINSPPRPSFRRTKLPKRLRMKRALENPNLIEAELCRRSLYYFIQTFWDTVSTDEFSPNWHIPFVCGELERVARRVAEGKPKEHDLIINIPPGTSKTTICSVMFPVWCWINWYWMRFITASYSGALSLESAEKSRDIVRSEKFQALFPYISIQRDKDTKSNFRVQRQSTYGIKPKQGGNRYSTSVGGTLTGFHGHILIVDDPLDPNRAFSETELRNANRWVDQTLSTRKVDKNVTPLILIMQRLHQNDPTGHILSKKKDNTRHLCIPGETRNFAEQVNPPSLKEKYKDGLLDPKRMPWNVLEEMKVDLGEYGYAGQVGQKPTPPGGGMFKVEHFQVVNFPPPPNMVVGAVRYWDKAGTTDGGAYTVGCKMIRTRDGKFLVGDIKRGQWEAAERERIIRETAEADGRRVVVYVEQEPGSGGKDSALATIRNLAGFSVYADRPTGNKVYRADPYSAQVNSGNVQLLRGAWNTAFIEEHRHFPFSMYKDQVDAASAAFNILTKRRTAGPVIK